MARDALELAAIDAFYGDSHILHGVSLCLGEGLVEQQQPRALRQRHGDLDAPPLAIGGLSQRTGAQMREADLRKTGARRLDQGAVAVEACPRIPAPRRQPHQREHDIVQQRVLGKERDDLIGAG